VFGSEAEGLLLRDYWKGFGEEVDSPKGDSCQERYEEDNGEEEASGSGEAVGYE